MGDGTHGRALLRGWGRTSPTSAVVVDLEPRAVAATIRTQTSEGAGRGVLARGLGRSYGDAAQNAGGVVLRVAPGPVAIDGDALTVTTSAGTSLHDLMRALLPHGLFPLTTPGTRQVTVGGAIACDVHGKNHHRVGSFGAHVDELGLVTGDGVERTASLTADPELFWATVGGMGLTGVITHARLRVQRVPSAWVEVETERVGQLDALLERMVALDAVSNHSVAWLDLMAQGRALGRSVLTSGEFAPVDRLTGAAAEAPFRLPEEPRLRVPLVPPLNLVRPAAVRAFNEVWFRKARPGIHLEHFTSFFHPLDAMADWNLAYGPGGFVQYQFVVPDDATEVLRHIIELVARSRRASFLNVLKRFGPGNSGFLSFPTAGWTLAVDLAADPDLFPLLARLDRMVLEAGGRIYLGKDSRMGAEVCAAMYPRLDDLRTVRRRTGAEGIFTSDLARRLQLDDPLRKDRT